MDKQKINEIIDSYQFESDFFNSIEEYLNFKNIPTNEISYCKFSIECDIRHNKINIIKNELNQIFTSCIACQYNNTLYPDKFFIFAPCTKNNGNKYQVTLFDKFGAIMDVARDNIIDLTNELLNCIDYKNYKLMEVIQ